MPKIYQKGQVTLPKEVRDRAGLSVDDVVIIQNRGDEVLIRKVRT